jgi:hypothetical protein
MDSREIIQELKQKSKAVRTTCLPEIKAIKDIITLDFDSVNNYQTNIVGWLKPVVDLSDFYVYPMNGITEGLNWWMASETRSIHMADGDYQWVKPTEGNGDILYMSNPSAIDGNWRDIPTDIPVALDLAYVGSTKIRKIELPDNVEYVFYSLSKSFGVRNVRTGWLFTREPIPRLEALTYNAKYYNYNALEVAETIMMNYPVDHIYNRLKLKQLELCMDLGFTPSDSVHIATTYSDEFKEFRRSDVARICISDYLNE